MGSKLKKRSSLQPKTGTKQEKRRFLICCEDKNAAPSYFRAIKRELRFSGLKVDIDGEAGEPLKMVKKAKIRQDSAGKRRADQGEPYDEVWCVLDVEAPQPHSSLDEALALARRNNIRCALTTPCFELWLLLHQRSHTGYLTTGQAQDRMRRLNCCYTADKDINPAHFTGQRRRDAIDRAAKLAENFPEQAHPTAKNPWTDVHILVGRLLAHT
ncbi:RloB family protein [Salinactinospora qingdaonensis]|uniref:RloB-like protein n=1 Tax=Salinactinospora qingdaonensis TaxID=702744 RepID=A0ABP7EWS3_9ACTN